MGRRERLVRAFDGDCEFFSRASWVCIPCILGVYTVYAFILFLNQVIRGGGPRRFLQRSQEQGRSHGSEGCGAPDKHQHRRPSVPDQETNFQQRLRPSSPPCLCPSLSHSSDLVQGVAMSTTAVMPPCSFVQTLLFSVSPSSFSLKY